MAFLRVDGLVIEVLVEDFTLNDVSVESYGRNVDDSFQGVTYSPKKEMAFETVPMTVADARAHEGWLRGRKHQWTFDRVDGATTRFTRFSADGGLVLASGASCGTSPLFGTWCLQLNGSAVTACATATFGSEGDWSISVYHHGSSNATFTSYGARSRSGLIRAFANGASVGTVGFLNVTASSGNLLVTLSGRDSSSTIAGATATASYENVAIYPYALTDSMFSSLASPRFGLPAAGPCAPPFVIVTGDALFEANVTATESAEPGPCVCKGFVESIPTEPLVVGTFDYDARQLRVKLVQR